MVTGQLTRSEAESALRRLEGLRDDWQRQVSRWTTHYEQAENIKKMQLEPSAPLVYTVEACCNRMGIATIHFNELERLIQDFRACALYLVHLPMPEGPDASFRSALPDLWSIPHAAPGTMAVALPGQVAGFSAQFAPVGSVQGLSSEIQMYGGYDQPIQQQQQQQGGGYGGMTGYGGQGGMPGMMSGIMQSGGGGGMGFTSSSLQGLRPPFQPSPSSFTSQSSTGGYPQSARPSFSNPSPSSASPIPSFSTPSGFNPASNTAGGYSSQPLHPQHTASMFQQQQMWQAQNAQQDRVNQFATNVFNRPGFQPTGPGGGGQGGQNVSPLNPFNPNAPHQAVLDASNRYPAVQ